MMHKRVFVNILWSAILAVELAGSRWDGSVEWTEKGRVQGQPVNVPYQTKLSFTFSADGTCTNNKHQPCKWEQKEQTVTINIERTKNQCPGSASLTVQGETVMSGSWQQYSGFDCFYRLPPRQIKLQRHK